MNKKAITAQNISKKLGDRFILSEVSFSIKKGSLVALIGPNGAGKSTLVKILLGLDKKYEGSFSIDQNETIAYISQQESHDRFALPISVEEYLQVGVATQLRKRKIKKEDMIASLKHVELPSKILSQSFGTLSGGERQRVAIARALMIEPTILVLDEPLAAVDFGARDGLYKLIRHLQQDHSITTLLISHDVQSIIPISDEILCLNQTIHGGCHPLAFIAGKYESHQGVHHHC